MFEKARILLYWARFGGLRLLTLRWQPHKRRLQGKWQCLLLVTTCPQRTFLHCVRMMLYIIWWVMHYYWLLSKGRGGKTQSNRSMCVRVIRRHVQQYVCVHIAEDAGSSVGKVNWTLCWVKAYSAQTKGPIKKNPVTGSWKAKHWAMVPSSQSQISGMDDHKRRLQANPRQSLVSKVVPTSEQDGWRDDIGRLRTPRRLAATQSGT